MRAIRKILYLLFGEWNGIQNFLTPAVLLFLFDKQSFLEWVSALLSYQRYYLPLFMYLIVLMFIMLLLIKAAVQWSNCRHTRCRHKEVRMGRDFMLPLVIRLHKWLLTFIIVVMFMFVLKSIFEFMFRTSLPLMTMYINLARIVAVAGLIYVYLLCDVTIPKIKQGHSFDRATRYFHKYLVKRWRFTLFYYANQMLLIVLSVGVFKFITDIIYAYAEFRLPASGIDTNLIRFLEVRSLPVFLGNVLLLPVAFLISNALYSPVMIGLKAIFNYLRKHFKNVK